jgi:voltage-gated potassium channel
MRWQDWVKGPAAYAALGMGGARRWDVSPKLSRIFIILMVFLAMALLLQWQLIEKQGLTERANSIFNIFIWLGFLLDFLLPIYWVKRKLIYVRDNWMLLIILLVGAILILPHDPLGLRYNVVRPILALYILVPSFSMILSFFVDGALATTLIAVAIIVIVFGLLVAGVDPNIHHAWDGFWWAVSTVSAVGYGDVVPTSFLGRMLGIILILIGIVIFVVLTANILGLILSSRNKKSMQHEQSPEYVEIMELISNIATTQKEQTKLLHEMKTEIDKLQKK